jgi:hypothetical protein
VSFVPACNGSPGGEPPAPTFAGVDLGIADDETYGRPISWAMATPDGVPEPEARLAMSGPSSRPGVSIAWRNAQQIEEVEVRVRNLGSEPGEGRVWVDILDFEGVMLLHLEPPEDQKVIRLPAVDRGGRDGKVLRMRASRELNNLIDRYDASRIPYHVQATVETVGEDASPFDNSKTKSWNIPFRVRPGQLNVYNYRFVNHGDVPQDVRWEFETTEAPRGWVIQGAPESESSFRMAPGESIQGALTMLAPDVLEERDFLETRVSLVDTETGAVLSQREWFQVYDTEPPHVSNYRLVFTNDHRLAIQALVSDRGSGVLEATGVTTEYSTDGGRTWSHRAHNYNAGNFTTPTLFEAVLGPFESGTAVQLRFTARDTGGNVTSIIPADAVGLVAPSGAEEMLSENYIFPRTQPNPIFDLSSKEATPVSLRRIESPGAELLEMTTLEVVVQ